MTPTQVKCALCDKLFKRITHKHLAAHGYTLVQYQTEFPNSALVSPATRLKFATNTVAHFITKYGEQEGRLKFEEHKRFLAHKNTSEYMCEKRGWSQMEYDAYNLSRASSEHNFVQRHGEVEGRKKWSEYVDHQRRAGITLEWFIQKHGEKDGTDRYNQICKQKATTLESYVDRYGEEGHQRYHDLVSRRTAKWVSAKEQSVAEHIRSMVPANIPIYSCLTRQFQSYSKEDGRLFVYDIVLPTFQMCIEFNGDYWHCNPTKYEAEYMHPHRKCRAADIWEWDENKLNHIRSRGYTTLVVWESDWNDSPEIVILQLRDYVERKI